jgi:Cof subfamily protein (haloacid dehalogenase superfamily)
MSARNEAALRAAIAQGIKVIFATGKTRHSANGLLDRLKLDTPGIYLQGLAVHYADGTTRHEQKLDSSVARRVITYAEDRGFDVIAYAGSRILVRAASAHADELTLRYSEPAPEVVGPLVNLLNTTQFNKLILSRKGDFKKIRALRWQLETQLNGAARLMQAGIMDMVEVLPPGASKARALKALLAELGVAPEHVLAVGDGENDIELIQMAGVGVAMGNAADALKQAADYVVADNDADGVAEAIERFALKAPEPVETPEAVTEAKEEAS